MKLVELRDQDGIASENVLALLASVSPQGERARAAEPLSSVPLQSIERVEALVRALSAEPSPPVRFAAAESLRALLARVPPMLRIEMTSRWAVSPHPAERAAIARALRSRVALFVSDLALELLASDWDPHVRALAARAMAHRIDEAPRAFESALERLTRDRDARVARTARRVVAALMAARRKAFDGAEPRQDGPSA